jgi:hypothetical protein
VANRLDDVLLCVRDRAHDQIVGGAARRGAELARGERRARWRRIDDRLADVEDARVRSRPAPPLRARCRRGRRR